MAIAHDDMIIRQPKRKSLRRELVDDTRDRMRAERIDLDKALEDVYVEASECAEFLEQESFNGIGHDAVDALGDKYGTDKRWAGRFDALWSKFIKGEMSADELIAWRDMQREALVDHCTEWAKRIVRESLCTTAR